MEYRLAIDIGASSGRHILGWIEDQRICTREVHRFENKMIRSDGHYHWDIDVLFENILIGMEKCRQEGCIPSTVAIDTWGVDYVLLDREYALIEQPFAYRDDRTEGADKKLEQQMSFEELYSYTGTAKQPFNTLYQLMSENRSMMEKADKMVFLPCYLHYLLCGVIKNEFSIASTAALLQLDTGDWCRPVLKYASIPESLLGPKPVMPGEKLGTLLPGIAERVGFSCTVIAPCTHDTGCAFMAVPDSHDHVIISSGTWSLLGVVLDKPITNESALKAGFTNEGAYGGKVRFLRNIMGLWMIQNLRKEWQEKYTFAEMASMAERAEEILLRINVDDHRYLAPESMLEEIKADLRERGCTQELTDGQIIAVVLRSLADCYASAIRELEKITGKTFTGINIVGGGCNNVVLNRWTQEASGLPVFAGPGEGTAIGNILCQMIGNEQDVTIENCGQWIRRSFDVKEYR